MSIYCELDEMENVVKENKEKASKLNDKLYDAILILRCLNLNKGDEIGEVMDEIEEVIEIIESVSAELY